MRYLSIFSAVERNEPPSAEEGAAMGTLIGEMAAAGVLKTTEGCMPSGEGGVRIRRSDGQVSVTDGPFTEAKEVVGGFAILEVASKEEAVEWTKRFMQVAGDGTSLLLRLYDQPAYDARGGGLIQG
jgi:hypothetical protein